MEHREDLQTLQTEISPQKSNPYTSNKSSDSLPCGGEPEYFLPIAEFTAENDLALIVINVKGYAQENHVRLRWSCNHSCELPWYNLEIPTAAISLNYTNHMINVPNVKTFINVYAPDRACIRAAIEKLTGKSPFLGKAEDTVFCGRWDTRV